MTIRTALITGAGWKFGEIESRLPELNIPYRCPELLYPLADGNTVLSRMIKQLRRFGVMNFYVAVGNPDSYRALKKEKFVNKQRNFKTPGMPGDSPWTWERVREVKAIDQNVKVVLINNPLLAGSVWESVLQLLTCQYGEHAMGNTICLAGDYVFDTGFLGDIVRKATFPSICWVLPVHDILFLNEYGVRELWTHIKRYPERGEQSLMGGNSLWKERELLEEKGFKLWEPDGDYKEYAPWIGRNQMFEHQVPLFGEFGTKPVEWVAAQIIAINDPVTNIL